jgi:hypothetical protein
MRRLGFMAVLVIVCGVSARTASADQDANGLGNYRATVTPDNRLLYTLSAPDFIFTRKTVRQTGESEIVIAGRAPGWSLSGARKTIPRPSAC